jgi:putative methionine-R-sulfoxide reductase with GAF domain
MFQAISVSELERRLAVYDSVKIEKDSSERPVTCSWRQLHFTCAADGSSTCDVWFGTSRSDFPQWRILNAEHHPTRDLLIENYPRRAAKRMSDEDKSELWEQSRDSPAFMLAEIARSLFAQPTVRDTLQRIVDVAAETIDGCDGAALLLVHQRKIVAGAWSSELVHDIEMMEYEIGEGPCIDVIRERPTFESADLRDEMSRWPTFAARALGAGIESILAFRLFASEETLGALDLYSGRSGAFDESARAFGTVFAAHAALALAGAQVHAHDAGVADGLREALVARDVIGQAKGILMATQQVDADTAFDLLRRTSQKQNLKLREIAEQVILVRHLPET